MEIQLTKNKVALVDDEDLERVQDYNWSITTLQYVLGYSSKTQKQYFLHRVIMNAKKGQQVDHINGNGLDNRKSNLRFATTSENSFNQRLSKRNKSGYKGVIWHKQHKKWMSYIQPKGKFILIGYFNYPHQAAMAYDIWAKELFGKYAHSNFKPAI